jgi:hypothetical protein
MTATIDKDLHSALKAARGGKLMQFAFFPKGSEGKLLVGKKVPPQQIAETKKATAASSVFKGRCVGEDGTLVFEVAKEPPGTLLGQLKKCLKDFAGLTCPVVIRVNPNAEAEHAEGEAEAAGDATAAPGTSESPRAGWEKALAEVEPAYLQFLRDHSDKASALRAVMSFAQGKAEKEDFPGAIAALRKLAEQLASLTAHPVTPDPVATALGAWHTARAAAVHDMRLLETAIAKSKDPDAGQAVLLLQAIIKNLTTDPGTLQSVLELEKYLTTDEIVAAAETPNRFGVSVKLRGPLVASLADLKAHLRS